MNKKLVSILVVCVLVVLGVVAYWYMGQHASVATRTYTDSASSTTQASVHQISAPSPNGTEKRSTLEDGTSFLIPAGWVSDTSEDYDGKKVTIVYPADSGGIGSPVIVIHTGTADGYRPGNGQTPLASKFDGSASAFSLIAGEPQGYTASTTDATPGGHNERYEKLATTKLGGLPAVHVHYAYWTNNSDSFGDEDIYWVRSGNRNWYFVAQNIDTRQPNAFDGLIDSVAFQP